MGLINDEFEELACQLLDELYWELSRNRHVVALGQGIGPISSPRLLTRARKVLPRLSLIALRESRAGLPLLDFLGVPRHKILVSGDDAIECGYLRRSNVPGSLIGLNLRVATYSGVDDRAAEQLSSQIHGAAETLNTSLLPIPISFSDATPDVSAISGVLRDSPAIKAGLCSERWEDIVDLVAKCRVVITGSYHAAVFAMSQGIPVIAIAQSRYYEDKFYGLQNQFGTGCTVMNLEAAARGLEEAICTVWHSSEDVRDRLRCAASQQIGLSREAYRLAYEMCTGTDRLAPHHRGAGEGASPTPA
jgi:colanic acid/amylovoran biosynthesis protein